MAAVRVPPSAWSTSQSRTMVFSPSAPTSMTARSERPMSREISWVRPPTRPLTDSRSLRVFVERGSIAYSAVTQPWPEPLRQRGTPSVNDAAHSTRVDPNSTRTLPSAWSNQPRVNRTSRSSSGARPSARGTMVLALVIGPGYRLRTVPSDVLGQETPPPGSGWPSRCRRRGGSAVRACCAPRDRARPWSVVPWPGDGRGRSQRVEEGEQVRHPADGVAGEEEADDPDDPGRRLGATALHPGRDALEQRLHRPAGAEPGAEQGECRQHHDEAVRGQHPHPGWSREPGRADDPGRGEVGQHGGDLEHGGGERQRDEPADPRVRLGAHRAGAPAQQPARARSLPLPPAADEEAAHEEAHPEDELQPRHDGVVQQPVEVPEEGARPGDEGDAEQQVEARDGAEEHEDAADPHAAGREEEPDRDEQRPEARRVDEREDDQRSECCDRHAPTVPRTPAERRRPSDRRPRRCAYILRRTSHTAGCAGMGTCSGWYGCGGSGCARPSAAASSATP